MKEGAKFLKDRSNKKLTDKYYQIISERKVLLNQYKQVKGNKIEEKEVIKRLKSTNFELKKIGDNIVNNLSKFKPEDIKEI